MPSPTFLLLSSFWRNTILTKLKEGANDIEKALKSIVTKLVDMPRIIKSMLVPINYENHWMLAVVLLEDHKILLLNSLESYNEHIDDILSPIVKVLERRDQALNLSPVAWSTSSPRCP